MKTGKALLYALCVSILILGVRIAILWSHISKIVGLCMIGISLLVLYVSYIKDRTEVAHNTAQINITGIILGLILILIDLSYNLYVGDEFRELDFGILTAGLIIIIMNLGLLRFLKLDEKMISFATYFIFIFMLSWVVLSSIHLISHSTENPFLGFITGISIGVSAFFLRFINPNVIATSNTINFDGFLINIADACSGVESITIFLAGVVAYFIAIKDKDNKKIVLYAIIGIGALFFMNVLRLMAIVLVGYHMGTDEMLFVHNFLGWIMFTLAMAIFWFLVFR